MKNNESAGSRRSVWVALCTTIALLIAVALWSSMRSVRSMSVTASDQQMFAGALAGDKIKLVLELVQTSGADPIKGKILEKKTEKIYLRTGSIVTVRSSSSTHVVMGQQSDIRPTAVVHVTGVMKSDRGIDAEQIVILTGYVEVQ